MTVSELNYTADLYVPSDNTPVNRDFFNKRFKALSDSIGRMDSALGSLTDAEASLIALGLERVNETLGPLLVTLQEASNLGFLSL